MTIESEVLMERTKLLLALELLQELSELACETVDLRLVGVGWVQQIKVRLYDLEHSEEE